MMSIVHNSVNKTIVGIAAHLVQKAWDVLTKNCLFESWRIVIVPCIWFNATMISFYKLSQRSDDVVMLMQQETHIEAKPPLRLPDEMKLTARGRSSGFREAILFVSCSVLTDVSEPICSYFHYRLRDEWPEQDDCRSRSRLSPPMLSKLSKSFLKALNIIRLGCPQLNGIEVDEDGSFVMGPDWHTAVTSLYRNCCLLCFTVAWADLKLNMKRSRSTWKCTMYIQLAINKRRKTPLDAEASSSSHNIN